MKDSFSLYPCVNKNIKGYPKRTYKHEYIERNTLFGDHIRYNKNTKTQIVLHMLAYVYIENSMHPNLSQHK